MSNEFWILGCVLSGLYNILTTPKKDFKKMSKDMPILIIAAIGSTVLSWFGLVIGIVADVNDIKKKLNK